MNVNRIIFFGTPEFAVPALDALVKNKKNVLLVVTQPDQPFGRGKKIKSPPVKQYCDEQGIACIQPDSIKTESFFQEIQNQKPDLMIVAAYGRIFPVELLNQGALVINIHASLLPRWRGASPISQAILHGDQKTGIAIMKLVKKLDAGPVMLQKSLNIDENDDTESLTQKLSKLGGDCLLESLNKLEKDDYEFVLQDEANVTYAPMLEVQDAQIHWNKPAVEIQRHIRAYSPSPGAFTSDGYERIKIFRSQLTNESTAESSGKISRQKKQLRVSCGDQWLDILEVQRPDKKRQGIVDFLNGYPQERNQWK